MRAIVKTAGLAIAVGLLSAAHADFSVGFGRMDVTPPIGTELSGYPQRRVSDGVLDPLDAIAIAFSDGTNRAVVISCDLINLRAYFDLYRKAVAKETGLDPQAVFIACTHTHTGPMVGNCTYGQRFDTFDGASIYEKSLADRLASAVKLALADLSPAKLSYARGEAKGIRSEEHTSELQSP